MRKFDINKVKELIDNGYLISQKHPTEDLTIYNYSQKTQYEGYWNEITLACRGLILDSQGQIHASTFQKFFNFGQKEANVSIPDNGIAYVYEKMDGSYIGSYWVNGELYLNTKGSFTFSYVEMATHILDAKYKGVRDKMSPELTYVFEVIFPAGRIVCDYGDRLDLVLLAVFDIATGKELPIEDFDFLGFSQPELEKVMVVNFRTLLTQLQLRNLRNKEGYVVKMLSDAGEYTRVKVKFDEYVYLHRIITNVTSYDIYDALRREGGVSEEILESVPDEFYDWVKMYEKKLWTQYRNVAESAFDTYFTILGFIKPDFTRHDFYNQVRLFAPSLLNEILSIYDLDFTRFKSLVWRGLKPPFEKPFQFAESQLKKVTEEVTRVTE